MGEGSKRLSGDSMECLSSGVWPYHCRYFTDEDGQPNLTLFSFASRRGVNSIDLVQILDDDLSDVRAGKLCEASCRMHGFTTYIVSRTSSCSAVCDAPALGGGDDDATPAPTFLLHTPLSSVMCDVRCLPPEVGAIVPSDDPSAPHARARNSTPHATGDRRRRPYKRDSKRVQVQPVDSGVWSRQKLNSTSETWTPPQGPQDQERNLPVDPPDHWFDIQV
ncbi:hypothetical protein BZA05DRAFT_433145 [Tricharina praecox]|uniref:uncharacterized protein n=1 Tax=Tricharina praecox TaxID=43433 RepID=UPI0022203E3C|nr:uncharacterized protein BZA05DRAFT_433145 [Tricharina praecox]KAI5857712.1 hypothetical protein BZA05DRAFT_433145 [Tricharina praecox]